MATYTLKDNDVLITHLSGITTFDYLKSADIYKPLIIIFGYDDSLPNTLCNPCNNHNGCFLVSEKSFLNLIQHFNVRLSNNKFIINNNSSLTPDIKNNMSPDMKAMTIFTDTLDIPDNTSTILFYLFDTQSIFPFKQQLLSDDYSSIIYKNSPNKCLKIDFLLNLSQIVIDKQTEGYFSYAELSRISKIKNIYAIPKTLKNFVMFIINFFRIETIPNTTKKYSDLKITTTKNGNIHNYTATLTHFYSIEIQTQENYNEGIKYKILRYDINSGLNKLNKLLNDLAVDLSDYLRNQITLIEINTCFDKKWVDGDGNCLFRAIANYLIRQRPESISKTDPEITVIENTYYKDVRNDICDFFQKNIRTKNLPNLGVEVIDNEYIANMRQDKIWAGDSELYAAAQIYNVHIFKYSEDAKWELFINQNGSREKMYLKFINRNHFEVLLPNGKCRLFDIDKLVSRDNFSIKELIKKKEKMTLLFNVSDIQLDGGFDYNYVDTYFHHCF